jgi:hypothetical protein
VDLVGRYVLALVVTIAVEACVACLLGFRTRRHILGVSAINTLTQPTLNYCLVVLGSLGLDVSQGAVVLLEILVVAVEGGLLVYVFGNPRGRLFLLSLLMNVASFTVGILLFGAI